MRYDEESAENKAAAARGVTKLRATKKIVASRSTNFTPINRQSEKDNENDEPAERPATQYSKRLLQKDDNKSQATAQPKNQKITTERPTPGKHAVTPTSSPATNTWAAISETPSASAAKSQHEKLLPLLAPKAQDVRKLQAELIIAQDKAKALQRVNKELKNEAAEARRTELGTRPLITRLMRTARISQGTLTKLISTISNYNLTMDEKTYLHSLAEEKTT